MTITQKIKQAATFSGISESELARRLNTSPSAFNQRLKTGKFSSQDLEKIATALGATFEFHFVFPDGEKI